MLLGQAVLITCSPSIACRPTSRYDAVLKLEKQQTQLQSGLEYVEKKMGKVYRKVVKAEEEVIHEGKVCCGCAKDQRRTRPRKWRRRLERAVGDERKLPEKSSFTRKHSFDSPRASSGLGFRATQLKVGLEWAPSLTLRRHFHHRLMLGLVVVLVVAMGRWVYAEIHSRTWLADFCGLAVDVVVGRARAAPFLVTAGMRLLQRRHRPCRRRAVDRGGPRSDAARAPLPGVCVWPHAVGARRGLRAPYDTQHPSRSARLPVLTSASTRARNAPWACVAASLLDVLVGPDALCCTLFRDTCLCVLLRQHPSREVLNLDTAGAGAPRRSSSFSEGNSPPRPRSLARPTLVLRLQIRIS